MISFVNLIDNMAVILMCVINNMLNVFLDDPLLSADERAGKVWEFFYNSFKDFLVSPNIMILGEIPNIVASDIIKAIKIFVGSKIDIRDDKD